MKHSVYLFLTLSVFSCIVVAQTPPPSTPKSSAVPQRPATTYNLLEYGVDFQADPRLIIMMAALEAAGFDSTPAGREPSVFRAEVRKNLANVDLDLRGRLKGFYERNKLPLPATPADQSARYISLALSLSQPPGLEEPARSEDLPAGLLKFWISLRWFASSTGDRE